MSHLELRRIQRRVHAVAYHAAVTQTRQLAAKLAITDRIRQLALEVLVRAQRRRRIPHLLVRVLDAPRPADGLGGRWQRGVGVEYARELHLRGLDAGQEEREAVRDVVSSGQRVEESGQVEAVAGGGHDAGHSDACL